MAAFREDFKSAISDCIEHPEREDSHVLDSISGRGSIYRLIRGQESVRRVEALIDELEKTLTRLTSIKNRATENQEPGAHVKGSTAVLRLASCELLMTNRYLDETGEFYQQSSGVFDRLTNMNAQLLLWEQNTDNTDKWFLKYHDSTTKGVSNLLIDLRSSYKRLKLLL